MRFFLKFSLILTIIIIFCSIILPRRYELTFPRDPGPELDNKVRTNYLEYLEENHPQLVLIGDSTLGASINAEELALQTKKTVYNISIPGSASALWYLIMKSNIAESEYKPETIVIVFRDSILTTPGYRVHGSYFELLDEYADHNEPLIMQNSYINFMSPFEIFAEKYFPL